MIFKPQDALVKRKIFSTLGANFNLTNFTINNVINVYFYVWAEFIEQNVVDGFSFLCVPPGSFLPPNFPGCWKWNVFHLKSQMFICGCRDFLCLRLPQGSSVVALTSVWDHVVMFDAVQEESSWSSMRVSLLLLRLWTQINGHQEEGGGCSVCRSRLVLTEVKGRLWPLQLLFGLFICHTNTDKPVNIRTWKMEHRFRMAAAVMLLQWSVLQMLLLT